MNSLNQSITALVHNSGTHYAVIELIGTVNVKAFQKLYREYVARYFGPTITFASVWFTTERGVMFTVSGHRAALDALPLMLQQGIQKELFNAVEVFYEGHGQLSFIRSIHKALLLYVKVGRSYGSHK